MKRRPLLVIGIPLLLVLGVMVTAGFYQYRALVTYKKDIALAQAAERERLESQQLAQREKLRRGVGSGGTVRWDRSDGRLVVRFGDKDIGEAELDLLVPFPELGTLLVRRPAWRKDGLGRLKGMEKIEILELNYAADDHVASIGLLASIRNLAINRSKLSDKGLTYLKPLQNLESLGLSGADITDDGLACLAGFAKLKRLELQHTKITDAGLTHLIGLTNLQFLYVEGSDVTDQGADKLRQCLPNLTVLGWKPAVP